MWGLNSAFVHLIVALILLLYCFALILSLWQAWKYRVERRLAYDLWLFPMAYAALLKQCGAYKEDATVKKHLQAIIEGYDETRILRRTGQVRRASQRYAEVKLCFHKARSAAAVLLLNSTSINDE